MEKIFISYKRIDKDRVLSIKNNIEKNVGVGCWIDLDGIESDAQFANVIINAINNAEVFLFMYSSSHSEIEDFDNDWTIREINFAQKKKKRIVFINIDGTPLTDWFELMFGTKQQIDASSDIAMQSLYRDLRKWIKIECDANTTFLTGYEFYYGMNGKEMDYTEAVYWYREAAEKGHIEAMYSLGNCYCHGKGVIRNYKKAKDLYERAAQLGHMGAQFNLGRCYKKGYGTPVNYSEAFAWFLKAAEQGYALAQNNVAVCYEQGIGVPVSEEKAVYWYQLANEQGDAFAHEALMRLGKLPKS